ncbi:hypothetical protein M378DRAFT_682138 [Amanita muscaria Koide BX008]|uniref:Uncharacterized protein n=1 Tax=Amanita muscaria (strain Koide BX008) TaxID=946122 RepID=A0A0C2XJD6_AMAMK|nr:hypothetical protein M378DRAFT_682138 [Amanita muscaria Koide BX008]
MDANSVHTPKWAMLVLIEFGPSSFFHFQVKKHCSTSDSENFYCCPPTVSWIAAAAGVASLNGDNDLSRDHTRYACHWAAL